MRHDYDEERRRMAVAYREGLGLAAVVAVRQSGIVRIIAAASSGPDDAAADEGKGLRLWCRGEAEATLVAAAAGRILRRTPDGDAGDAVRLAAKRLGVVLQTEAEIADAATTVAARVAEEIKNQQQSGALKSVNQAYRSYRLEANARGERALRYDAWMQRYREDLVRQVAATLRQI